MIDRAIHSYMRNTRILKQSYDRWLDSYPEDVPEDDELDEPDNSIEDE